MHTRTPFIVIVSGLLLLGFSNIYYRHVEVGVPLTPGKRVDVWQIEAEITFQGRGGPVTASLSLPRSGQFELIEEFTASPAFGVNVIRDDRDARAIWSKREVNGPQTLYYQAAFTEKINPESGPTPAPPGARDPLPEPYESSAQAILSSAYARSGNQSSLVAQTLLILGSDDQNAALLMSEYTRTESFLYLMDLAKVATKMARGLALEDGRRNQRLVPFVKVYVDGEWQLKNIESGIINDDTPVLVWLEDRPSLLDVVGGESSRIRFSIGKRTSSALTQANTAIAGDNWNFGLYNLPIAEQNLFKGILLIPIGALVVVFMRIIVGLRTSGTFMPILIATSFIHTELLNGLVGFVTIVSIGLIIRSYLSKLNLLLVARISAGVMVVIGLIAVLTMFAFQLGLSDALKITFFPMIIMAWTIERMSIIWEEEGSKEVMIQGFGSLFVAVLAYLCMDNSLIRHWAFNFLGVHAFVMAAVLMMGQYTGYRLSELQRFRPLAQ